MSSQWQDQIGLLISSQQRHQSSAKKSSSWSYLHYFSWLAGWPSSTCCHSVLPGYHSLTFLTNTRPSRQSEITIEYKFQAFGPRHIQYQQSVSSTRHFHLHLHDYLRAKGPYRRPALAPCLLVCCTSKLAFINADLDESQRQQSGHFEEFSWQPQSHVEHLQPFPPRPRRIQWESGKH